jgi:hypothetical protein
MVRPSLLISPGDDLVRTVFFDAATTALILTVALTFKFAGYGKENLSRLPNGGSTFNKQGQLSFARATRLTGAVAIRQILIV